MMVYTRQVRIKVTPLQFEIIKSKAQAAGYKTVSAFIRDTILKTDYSMEKLVKQIHEMVMKEKRHLK